jgi:hypothetical protein
MNVSFGIEFDFQLPLSGSRAYPIVVRLTDLLELSTPSLGITHRPSASPRSETSPPLSTPSLGITSQRRRTADSRYSAAFQLPLSGSPWEGRARKTREGAFPFNSLSRDHFNLITIQQLIHPIRFQLPLSGSQLRPEPCQRNSVELTFNSLSRDHGSRTGSGNRSTQSSP